MNLMFGFDEAEGLHQIPITSVKKQEHRDIPYDEEEYIMKIITGGVTAAKVFRQHPQLREIKYQGRTDMAMVYSEKPCVAAGTLRQIL